VTVVTVVMFLVCEYQFNIVMRCVTQDIYFLYFLIFTVLCFIMFIQLHFFYIIM